MTMPILLAALLGLGLGAWRAARRGGNLADMVQYALGHAIAFGICVMLTLFILDVFL